MDFSPVCFLMLVNGIPSGFVQSSQAEIGSAFIPLLFIIVMEALSRLLETVRRGNYISGFSIGDLFANQLMISHLLFLDDTLILFWAHPQ